MAKKITDNWQQLLKNVELDDGLPTREAGPWTFDKLWWWNRYIEITTRAMADKPQWNGLTYVDLFAGPGVCESRSDGDRTPGSALIAAQAPKPFHKLLLCEESPELADACEQRLARIGASTRSKVFRGDCNERIHDIVNEIPDRSLTLAFVDPTGLHADFDTIRILTENRRVDLFILFADHMDIVRNMEIYADQTDSNLDKTLGPTSNWRDEWRSLASQTPTNVASLFAKLYKRQLSRHLGYEYSDDEVLKNSQGTPIYRLVFGSKDPRGLDFWRKTAEQTRQGPRLF